MNDQEIVKVARELAAKSGISFDDIPETDIMRGAYLHNAEEAIKDRQGIEAVAAGTVPVVTCSHCQDKAFVNGEPCGECNPMGLPVEQVHPGAVVEINHQVTNEVLTADDTELLNVGYDADPYYDKTVELPLTVITRPIDLSPTKPPQDAYAQGIVDEVRKDEPPSNNDRRDNKTPRSPDTGQPSKPQKPKAKRKPRAKAK